MKLLKFLYRYKYIIASGLLGALCFIWLYGTEVLNPNNIGWLVHGGDLSQHYVGWEFYRYSPWTFPIGLITNAAYPDTVSVIFTDSIPLFAVIFKLFARFLPLYFQYMGIYGIFCFIMIGMTSSIVLKKFIKNDLIVVLTSLFFIVNPIVLHRMYYHTSLSSHYLIFMAMILALYKDKLNLKKTILFWGILGVLCSSTHIYFIVMIGIILVGYMLYELIDTRNFKKVLLAFVSYLASSFITVYLLGGFSLPVTPFGSNSIGTFNFNFNSFINPMRFNYTMPKLETASNLLQEEGFAYLGKGLFYAAIVGAILIVVLFIVDIIKKKKLNVALIISIIVVALISLIIATANSVYYGNTLLFKYHVPDKIQYFIGVFRSNGRFIWVVYYVIVFVSLYAISRVFKKFWLIIPIILLLIIQYGDMKPELETYKHYHSVVRMNRVAMGETWEQLFQEDFKTVVFSSDSVKDMYQLDLLAMKYHKNVNRFYIAQDLLRRQADNNMEIFIFNLNDENLFIIDKKDYFLYDDMDLYYYELGDAYIATTRDITYLNKVKPDYVVFESYSFSEVRLNDNYEYIIVVRGIDSSNTVKVSGYDVQYVDNIAVAYVNHDRFVQIKIDGPLPEECVQIEITRLGEI